MRRLLVTCLVGAVGLVGCGQGSNDDVAASTTAAPTTVAPTTVALTITTAATSAPTTVASTTSTVAPTTTAAAPTTTKAPTTTVPKLPAGAKSSDPPAALAVFARIEALNDCASLQDEFDTAAANHDRDSAAGAARSSFAQLDVRYMQAADKQLKVVGCY